MDAFTRARPAQGKTSAATGQLPRGLGRRLLRGAAVPGRLLRRAGGCGGHLAGEEEVGLGPLIAGGAFGGYAISRTVGLPGLPVEAEGLEPLGVLSLVVEGLFVGLCLAIGRWKNTPQK